MSREEILAKLTAAGSKYELLEDVSAGYPVSHFRNAPASLRRVLETTSAHGDAPFLVYRDEAYSYRRHYEAVATLAHHLLARGVRKGDRVAIGMRNYPEWVIGFWACQAIGAIVVALNAWWTSAELDYALDDCDPAALIVDDERLERILPSLGSRRSLIIVTARCSASTIDAERIEDILAEPADRLPAADIAPGDISTILYTSGTTGRPKGACATHRNHVNNIMNVGLWEQRALMAAGIDPAAAGAPGGTLQTGPFFHIGGLTGLYCTLARGGKLALMYKWNANDALDLVEHHALTSLSAVPFAARQLLETAIDRGADLSSLASITIGGAPVPPDIIGTIIDRLPTPIAPVNGYGLTETCGGVLTNSGPECIEFPTSVGRPMALGDYRLVDSDGQDCAAGEIGELWIRGANIFAGYWKNPEATAAAIKNGWFMTGDLGYRDADGRYYIVDRLKDVIIRAGENIYSSEVEAAILEIDDVRDAGVVGLADHRYGEVVGAVIRIEPADAAKLTGDAIIRSLERRIAKFKIPSVIRLTHEELPRTASGKLLKPKLRELLEG